MAEERLPHRLVLEERKRLTMTAVSEVISFEEDGVVLKTALGTVVIQGRGLKLRTLTPDSAQMEVEGTITAIAYEEPRERRGWARRLLG